MSPRPSRWFNKIAESDDVIDRIGDCDRPSDLGGVEPVPILFRPADGGYPMKEKRIAIYGGTDLEEASQKFVQYLAQAILKTAEDIVILTGGYRLNPKLKDSVPTDSQVVKGIETLPEVAPHLIQKRLCIMQPDPAKDRSDAIRYKPEDTNGTVVVLKGDSARKRRFKLVTAATVIVTVKGYLHTSMLLDAALAAGKPFLPLPFTGGDSREYWDDCRDRICRWSGISAQLATEIEKIDLRHCTDEEKRQRAEQIARILTKAIERVCLLALPSNVRYRGFYDAVLAPAIAAAGFTPRRLDEAFYSGRALAEYFRSLHDSDRVIADVPDYNPNVMYEIGCAHASNIFPLLLDATPARGEPRLSLPFYLKDHIVYFYDGSDGGPLRLIEQIRTWLLSVPKPPGFAELG
jgi:hypothetical protein